jgi:glycosyltransferase involved in cell wall biosynthesis
MSGIARVRLVDQVTPEFLESGDFTHAIYYDVTALDGIGRVIPSIYYSTGIYDPALQCGALVTASRAACVHDRFNRTYTEVLKPVQIIPPAINSRQYRKYKLADHRFTVAILSNNNCNEHPSNTIIKLLNTLDGDIRILVTDSSNKCQHPSLKLAMDDRLARCGSNSLHLCQSRPSLGIKYIMRSDVVVLATNDKHIHVSSRMALEAAAAGKLIVCPTSGVYPELFEHERDALFYDTDDMIHEYICQAKYGKYNIDKFTANTQLRASWFDTGIHIPRLECTMRYVNAE